MTGKISTIIVLLIGLLILASPIIMERQVMPGPLSKYHEKLADYCNACHDPFTGTSAENCCGCHTAIQEQREKGTGLHSNITECGSCHHEHRGTEYPIASILPLHFSHEQTGFYLTGAHAHLACNSCHSDEKKLYTGLKPDCGSCHTGWKEGHSHKRMNKEFQTVHSQSACLDCHTHGIVDPEPLDCSACHDDEFFDNNFNHTAIGGVSLGKFHEGLTCQRCHKEGYFHLESPFECVDCHTGWTPGNFSHYITGTKLDPVHQKVSCSACHTNPADNFKGVSETCTDCHTAWKQGYKHTKLAPGFMTLHKKVECNSCHTFSKINWSNGTCTDCHKENWIGKHFNHDVTGFSLGDNHSGLDCDQCHTKGRQHNPPVDACLNCHDKDDIKGIYP